MIEATAFTPWSALIGGVLIGLSAVMLMASIGRIAGITGIVAQVITAREGRSWQLAFLSGLMLAAIGAWHFLPAPWVPRQGYPMVLLVGGGLLVGFGTQLGSGCTSGHGVCGLARLSPRSLAATVVFMVVGVVTAVTLRHYLWVLP